jgi:ABC-type molybdate transport system ATPase subunit
MDEPLASLDAARKGGDPAFIERLRDHLRLPIVYVTHDLGRSSGWRYGRADVRRHVAALGTVDEILDAPTCATLPDATRLARYCARRWRVMTSASA